MPDTTRTFIAIELTDETKKAIAAVQEHFKKLDADVRWVKPENTHFTLRFLGSLIPKKLKALMTDFPSFFEDISSFETKIDCLGAFPKIEKPRVIWVGVTENTERFSQIHARLEDGLCRLGYPKEERFVPHLTIGRVRSPRNLKSLSNAMAHYTFAPVTQKISTVTLFKSTLGSQDPTYEALSKVELK